MAMTVGEMKKKLEDFFDDEPLVVYDGDSGMFLDIESVDYEDNDNDEDIDVGVLIFASSKNRIGRAARAR